LIGVSNLGLAKLIKSAGKAGDVLSEFAISEAPLIRSQDAGEAYYAPHSPIIRALDKNPTFEIAAVNCQRHKHNFGANWSKVRARRLATYAEQKLTI